MEELYLGKESTAYKMRGQQRRLEMSPIDIRKGKHGDENQGDFLNQKKFNSPRGSPRSISANNRGPPQPHYGNFMPPQHLYPGYDFRDHS